MTAPTSSTPTGATEPAEYVLLLVGDADRWWTTMTDQDRRRGYAAFTRFGRTITERGHRITAGAELHATPQAHHLRPGEATAHPGPFRANGAQIGGMYHVETSDLDDLLACCAILTEIGEGVEVRRAVRPQERPSAPADGSAGSAQAGGSVPSPGSRQPVGSAVSPS